MKRPLVASFVVAVFLVAAPALTSAQLTSIPPAAPTTSIPGRVPDVIDQTRQRALAPIPRAPVPSTPSERWVPERRFYSAEYGREIVIPGHYETRITDQQYAVPPITGYGPQGQGPVFYPGGQRPPADLRQGP